ncbi:MAG TPA: response regulator, partial [Thermoanaerobaculia bacterium]|nr:response regulator [Thermoanaerobaculia bacterium]
MTSEATGSAGPIRVLLVDDSKSVRAVLRRFFSWTDDIEVVGEAADGAEAVRLAVSLEPEVILMDLLMPGVDGYSAIEEIMRRRPAPILVLSAKATRNQVQTAFEAFRRGAVEVLPKPEDTESWRHLATTLPDVVRGVARHGGRRAAQAGGAEAAENRAAVHRAAESHAAEARAAESRAAR